MWHSFLAFWHTMYLPNNQPFYNGLVWGNVFVIVVLAPLGWLWSKTKFFPLNVIHRKLDGLHEKHDQHAEEIASMHEKIDALHQKHDELHKALTGGTGPGTSNPGG